VVAVETASPSHLSKDVSRTNPLQSPRRKTTVANRDRVRITDDPSAQPHKALGCAEVLNPTGAN